MAASPDNSAYSVFKQDGSHQFYCRWTVEEDLLLSKAVADHGPHKWTLVSRFIPGRTAVQCSTRWFGALNPNVHKGRWSNHEDQALTEAVQYFQSITKSASLPWNRIAENIPHRTGIQCQARWTEALDPAVRKGRWHPDEDKLLSAAIAQYGCCWIRVASMIPTRTQRQCRTRWNQIHSQQLKAASTSLKGLSKSINRRTSSFSSSSSSSTLSMTPPIHFEFVPSVPATSENDQFMNPFFNNSNTPTTPSSPTAIDDILAQYGTNSNNISSSSSLSSTTSRSSSYSSASSYSPSSSATTIFPTTPIAEQPNLLQHDLLFPVMEDNNNNNNKTSNNNRSMSNFLLTTDFDFLLNYNLGPQ